MAAGMSIVILYVFSGEVADKFRESIWNASNLYSAVFGWAAIQTGFAFGVYGFIAGRRDGFVGALQGTIAMVRFVTYVKRAVVAGFILTFFSLPLIIAAPSLDAPFSWSFLVAVCWFSIFVWAFCAFLRLAYNFGRIARVKDNRVHRA